MKELTLKMAVEKKFTPIKCVKYYFSNKSNKWCDGLLWEQTCFPFDMETTLKQLYNIFKCWE
jgi:hypothetical protein